MGRYGDFRLNGSVHTHPDRTELRYEIKLSLIKGSDLFSADYVVNPGLHSTGPTSTWTF